MEDFYVAYSSTVAKVHSVSAYETFYRKNNADMDEYKYRLTRYPEKQYGDIITYNNQFHGIIGAENAGDALAKFIEKMKKDWDLII